MNRSSAPRVSRRQPSRFGVLSAGLLVATLLAACGGDGLDRELRTVVERLDLAPLDRPAPAPPELIRLGQSLFFDKELGGNRDIACATCHHPAEQSADGRSLPIGTGGRGLGPARTMGVAARLVPRHSPELYNRGAREWTAMFWDGRVDRAPDGSIRTPAGEALPEGLDGVLAAQALFPVTSREEMRGAPGDTAAAGGLNEIALIADDDLPAVWDALMARLLAIEGYRDLFAAAYPDVPAAALGFQHAANAIAAYEAAAFWFADTPWDAYLRGDDTALLRPAKRGALLFFGKGRCSTCHAGALFSDQRYHNVAAPQVGPGKGSEAPQDLGRALVTGERRDRCAFRTPSLRNVALTGPWMHDGAFVDLEAAVRHMADPVASLAAYDAAALDATMRSGATTGPSAQEILETLDPMVAVACDLTPEELADLVAFLYALTDPAAGELSHLVPTAVPSGLPVDGVGG